MGTEGGGVSTVQAAAVRTVRLISAAGQRQFSAILGVFAHQAEGNVLPLLIKIFTREIST
jgi:hypothetical protein